MTLTAASVRTAPRSVRRRVHRFMLRCSNVQVEEDKEKRVKTTEGGVLTERQQRLLFSPKLWASTLRHWGKS